ncbi:fatty acid-binding protein, heart-like [Alosa pseudoharengus]|uniref:fatty acid-binding protein, heart-like n=1 Tax=Alosa pseudoharengus TaxID=34774 RepID=UPI003F889399
MLAKARFVRFPTESRCTPAHLNVDFQTHHPRDQTTHHSYNGREVRWDLEVGVGFAKRQIACKVKPSMTISVDADGTINVQTERKDMKFKLNEEFEVTTGDDRKTKNVVKLDNGVLVQRQTWEGKEMTIERELVSDKLVTKLKIGEVVAVRTFEKEA